MIRRPPRSTLDRSSAASDVYKRQVQEPEALEDEIEDDAHHAHDQHQPQQVAAVAAGAVSYTHLRAHETVLDLVCRLLLEKKKNTNTEMELRITHSKESTSTIDN